MTRPEGNLTAVQHEIMQAVWDSGQAGASVAEIWQVIAATRPVGRTTVLNLVDRLEKRGWLQRATDSAPIRYQSALSRQSTATLLARKFVDDFFGGSASSLVMSLVGERRLRSEEIDELRRLIESAGPREARRKAD